MRKGTLGPDVVDIGALYQDTGRFTYDPGFTSTASCKSKITFIDFDKGIVLYRGYPIEQLAEHSTFLETCYLLLYGELPTAQQFEAFEHRVVKYAMVHEQMTRFYSGFPAMRIRWRSWSAWSGHSRRSIATRSISGIERSVRWQVSA